MKMNKKMVLALAAATLGVGAGGAYAATSGPDRSTPAPVAASAASQPAAAGLAASIATSVAAALAPSQSDRAAAAPASPAPTPANLHDLVSAAIARAVADRHISTTEAALANLFLDGQIRPDPVLRTAWRPVVQAVADALGLSVGSLEADLAHGMSLADVAGQQGRPPAAVAQAIESSSQAALATAVADGALSAAASADILELLQTHMSDLLEVHG